MASIVALVNRKTKRPNGRKRVNYQDENGRQKFVYLGRMPDRDADTIKVRVEALVASKISRRGLDPETAAWMRDLPSELAKKLAAVGLIREPQPGDGQAGTLAAFLDRYISKRAGVGVKGSTATAWGHTRRCLVKYFGPNKHLADITAAAADEWRLWLMGEEKLAENTVRRRCGVARQFFANAVKSRLIRENPFAGMKGCAVLENKEREYFVERDVAARVLDKCPDAQWRLLFALSRYGGLRCPSEHLALRWSDVDWERDRMTVHAPKTEHHRGKATRQIPLFPELRTHLEEVWDQAEPGAEYIITRYRDCNANLRTQLCRIIARAGLEPWPKLFHNLRATRETELAGEYPLHVVCEWIGNSMAVAKKHYQQVTEADFQKAAETPSAHRNAHRQPAPIPSNATCSTEETPGKHGISRVLEVGEWAQQDSNL